MTASDVEDFNGRVAELSRVLLSEGSIDTFLERVTDLSTELIPACDSCSVSVAGDRQVYTRASSDCISKQVDEHQYSTRQGPCLDAIASGRAVSAGPMAEEGRWPSFSPLAASAGVKVVYSVPLKVEERTVGALNLYGVKGVFEDNDKSLAEAFAGQAAVAVANAAAYHQARHLAEHLEEALKSRDVIGQAKGIIMERERVTADRAFEMLRTLSQATNVKLREVAERVVFTGSWSNGKR